MRLLLVEDSEDIGEAIVTRLRSLGHAVEWLKNGIVASQRVGEEDFDAIVLDVMLPGRDGLGVLVDLRKRGIAAPVLVITARSEIDDKVNLLDLGADDYLVKPFDMRELEARLRALLRRPGGMTASVTQVGNVVLDMASRTVTVADHRIEFGRREFRLLEILLGRIGHVVPKERLMAQLFGLDEDVTTNALELHISRIRRKLEYADLEIVTIRGIGYVVRQHVSA
uniref:Response regulator transcription factor n=1 Tax=Bosea sp. NBC_00436 TaxID=2969620 RepID=A0A9E8A3Y0_9HYPH